MNPLCRSSADDPEILGVVDVPVVMSEVQKTMGNPQIQFIDRTQIFPITTQRKIPTIKRAQEL